MEQSIEMMPFSQRHMENHDVQQVYPIEYKPNSSPSSFIEANTVNISLEEIDNNHILPVFLKTNEPLISHTEFIRTVHQILLELYPSETVLAPAIRLSHPIKGRIPSAKDKPANMLAEHEKTIFYERMMFVIELPGIKSTIAGSELSLTVGGVKSYSLDNMYQHKGDQHFKLFIGFQNKVCTNLCLWSDGYISDLCIKSIDDLALACYSLIKRYNSNYHLHHLEKLNEHYLSEKQFAQIIGRTRMYQVLPASFKKEIPALLLGDQQIGSVVKAYYTDDNFKKCDEGNLNLWSLYNLLTGVNKSSYIDTFLDRSINAYNFTEQIRLSLEKKSPFWYLD